MREPQAVVIVGAGLGALRAAEALRREGYEGRLTMIGEETVPPYDRPPLSKEVLTGTREPESVFLRAPEDLDRLELDLRLGEPASGLDLHERAVVLASGRIPFDGLIIATGATPRTLPLFDGIDGVHTLRTLDDSLRLAAAFAAGGRLVVIGAGFIGSEVAASARKRGLEVTIVELETAPLARAIGAEMGAALMELHRANGTELRLGVTVTGIEARSVKRLRLSDGTSLEADLVLVGIGVTPTLGWLDGSGLTLDNGVVCDAALNAGAPGVYAIGDVANWPNELFDRRMRVEHWTNTIEQARHAARNLLHGRADPFRGSNYVWSHQYGTRIQFAGISAADEIVVVDGSVEEQKFVAWYRQGERLVGAMGLATPKLLMETKLLIEQSATWADALATLGQV